MSFASDRQRKFLFSQKPDVARKIVKDARKRHEPITKKSRKRRKKK
jgi:hypothetical protein